MDFTPVLVKDINPGSATSFPRYLTEFNGNLFFSAIGDGTGTELWKSDGTSEGTVLVKDIFPGSYSNSSGYTYIYSSYPSFLTEFNGTLFFRASDEINGAELWKSDGTAEGTVLVKNILPGRSGSRPRNFFEFDGNLFFRAVGDGTGAELWKSDGTEVGTVRVKDIDPGPMGSYPGNFGTFDNHIFFSADDGINGRELWKSDGTAEGTVFVKDINPGPMGSSPDDFTELNGALFFTADDGINGRELWKSDGTAEGTVLVKDIFPGSSDYYGYGPIVPNSSGPGFLTEFNGRLFFSANDGINGTELWKSDGTAEGTVLLKNIRSINRSSYPANFTELNGSLFFTATDDIRGAGLWTTDGTLDGTVLVADISPPGSNIRFNSDYLTEFNGSFFFEADDGVNGRELWALVPTADPIDPETGVISNKVWVDSNGNGLFDSEEKDNGVTNLPVVLTEAGPDGIFGTQDDITQTETTNLAGTYRFRNLPGGTYQVSVETLPEGFEFTAANVGQNEGLDSDVDPLTGTTDPIVLAPEEVNFKVDIGLVETPDPNDPKKGIIGNRVWLDANANGLFDFRERGIAGLTVVLESKTSNGTFETIATDRTNRRGRYRFNNLPGGDYRVSLSKLPEGRSYTTPNVGTKESRDSDVLPSTGTTEVIPLEISARNLQVDIGLI